MTQAYAVGKKARGFCDRCGFDYLLEDLKAEVVDLKVTGIRVCPECWDPDQPQRQLGRFPISDPQALRNPRPNGEDGGRYSGVVSANSDGEALRHDFLTGEQTGNSGGSSANYAYAIEGWFYKKAGAIPQSSAVVWDSSEQTITLNVLDPANTRPRLINWDYYGGGGGLSIDTSIYSYIRMRMRIKNPGTDTQQNSWFGTAYWGHEDSSQPTPYPFGTPHGGGQKTIPSPNFSTMGNPWHILTWDLSSLDSWENQGTVTALRFDLFDYESTTTTKKTIEIDWIRIESA